MLQFSVLLLQLLNSKLFGFILKELIVSDFETIFWVFWAIKQSAGLFVIKMRSMEKVSI